MLAFVVGTGVVAFAALADRRALLLRGDIDLEPLPADVVREPTWRAVASAAYPSTLGVSCSPSSRSSRRRPFSLRSSAASWPVSASRPEWVW